ncbi:MAG: peptidase S8, partial [Pseudomonadota bacterium]
MVSAARSFKFVVACFLLVLVACTPIADAPPTDGADASDVVGQRRVVALLPTAQDRDELRLAARAAGYTELDAHRLEGLGLWMVGFRTPDGVTG